jgi:hypothetical protein
MLNISLAVFCPLQHYEAMAVADKARYTAELAVRTNERLAQE